MVQICSKKLPWMVVYASLIRKATAPGFLVGTSLPGRTLLLDKSSFCGGNSTKATSGINGAGHVGFVYGNCLRKAWRLVTW